MEECGRWENTVFGRRVGDCVSGRASVLLRAQALKDMFVSWIVTGPVREAVHNASLAAYLTTSPTLTAPVWCSNNMLLAYCSRASNSFRDVVQTKNEDSGRVRPSSAFWASEYVRGVSSI